MQLNLFSSNLIEIGIEGEKNLLFTKYMTTKPEKKRHDDGINELIFILRKFILLDRTHLCDKI